MTYESKTGLPVNNQYGPRDTGGAVGLEHGYNSGFILSVQITPEFFNGGFMPPVVVPKGALMKRFFLRVDEAFTLTGTTPGIVYGRAGAEATDGIALTAAELSSVGTKTPASTGTGTWATNSATGTTVAAKLGKATTGTTPAATVGAGKAVLVIEYFNKAKA